MTVTTEMIRRKGTETGDNVKSLAERWDAEMGGSARLGMRNVIAYIFSCHLDPWWFVRNFAPDQYENFKADVEKARNDYYGAVAPIVQEYEDFWLIRENRTFEKMTIATKIREQKTNPILEAHQARLQRIFSKVFPNSW